MKFTVTLKEVQHISNLTVEVDLTKNKIICIAGKNSVGKTTLVRAIRNLSINNTFQETAAPYIFNRDSSITYSFDDGREPIVFSYSKFVNSIDTKQNIPSDIRGLITVELPIPHGERFNHFQRLAGMDEQLRARISVGDYNTPNDLIIFLNSIYGGNRFDSLKEILIGRELYYFIIKDDEQRYYIREDYLSSGEYFLINLYKQFRKRTKLIVVDEIDISLDASAQVKLVEMLRKYCQRYQVNILFTTHSLALIKTLLEEELYYAEAEELEVKIFQRSYNYIKSIMYGFKGWDRYILTEDECLQDYIEYLVSNETCFYKFQVIYIGGATQVIDLKNRNIEMNCFGEQQHVLAVLDGDQVGKGYLSDIDNVVFLPFDNIEMEIFRAYNESPEFPFLKPIEFHGGSDSKRAKSLFKMLLRTQYNGRNITFGDIYSYLETRSEDGVRLFKNELLTFLNVPK
ncbi:MULTISPECIES: AAA family ATPase [unclassified Shewanella]|uniref:AAA family ATPase n=1 Tax=unclassified Shewanella TaxID=196818 RepID=UPI0018E2C217|nr:AAA family ATPase [Shewanella sp. DW31]MBI1673022.1 ATP-binding protein [Shewanella sp. DW31]GCF88433.1 hypothetical protein SMBr_06770 [Shewanella sp. M-Br]